MSGDDEPDNSSPEDSVINELLDNLEGKIDEIVGQYTDDSDDEEKEAE